MTPNQTSLYWRSWQAAARAHGWTTRAGIADALASHQAGQVWESPQLNECLRAIYESAGALAARDYRAVTADDLRHACTMIALGRDASSKAFSNPDFDRVLSLLRLLADPIKISNLLAVQDSSEAGERRRHIHVITQAPDLYWQKISTDRFGHADLDRLTMVQVRQLSLTIRTRLRKRAANQGKKEMELATA